ncbi:MAG: hypothetical protein KUF72_17980 [Candidatus Thiodiazotropha sp. (ex Ctena orbiculata)]|nr:hypothetical protein [Candidatus Thiodiazotropha taylori]
MIIFIPRGVYEIYRRIYGIRRPSGRYPQLEDLELPYSPTWDNDFLGPISGYRKAKIPLFDPFRRHKNFRESPGFPVPVRGPRHFTYKGIEFDELPKTTPIVTIRPTRNKSIGAPRTIYIRDRSNQRVRPEYHRRRRDKKVGRGYRRLLSFVNRTYGRFDEFVEVADAFGNNVGPVETLTALAVNEAVDFAYGARARALRKHIYSKKWYVLPVGIDAITGGYGLY